MAHAINNSGKERKYNMAVGKIKKAMRDVVKNRAKVDFQIALELGFEKNLVPPPNEAIENLEQMSNIKPHSILTVLELEANEAAGYDLENDENTAEDNR
ncbi:hypothetical protein L6452_30944 [Arctium lappa]|uniref:Uncharacterized protein n=2 Tax=Arctium lappa TaxID=4217 RepID=A0ACB8ZK17_ARCLA|nr:hypothetical protein L6452_31674 [Arctium lappa]KAI3697846.1 hypothetical protein L6452_30944 [Arctium lappa]